MIRTCLPEARQTSVIQKESESATAADEVKNRKSSIKFEQMKQPYKIQRIRRFHFDLPRSLSDVLSCLYEHINTRYIVPETPLWFQSRTGELARYLSVLKNKSVLLDSNPTPHVKEDLFFDLPHVHCNMCMCAHMLTLFVFKRE